ncbi:glycosyltransferase [Streptomyces sp. NPDC127092]|uniref:glycosyltransferase family protein n=1 Tax=Streptomyces sp. NPDC127092 TaxID=3347135 RepID=UPI003647C3B3
MGARSPPPRRARDRQRRHRGPYGSGRAGRDRADVDVHFEPGREVLVFADGDELAEHAERAIREPVWARGIAEAGRRRALAEHTLVHRMREVEVLWA